MKYITDNGESLEGDSPTEVLTALRDGSKFEFGLDLEAYLDALVLRLADYYGGLITSRDHGEVIDEMITIGFLRPVA